MKHCLCGSPATHSATCPPHADCRPVLSAPYPGVMCLRGPGAVGVKAPFPYFGGKSRIAGAVWERFGDVPNFVEPFFGSGAVLLSRPQPFAGSETVNDLDGMIANYWRATQADPDAVAQWADWPVNENDLIVN